MPLGLYRRARDLLGDAGIVNVTALMGWFTTVSLTLMAYDVPDDAVGPEQEVAEPPVMRAGKEHMRCRSRPKRLGGRLPPTGARR